MKVIELTEKQKDELKDLFSEADMAYKEGKLGCIMAQIHPQHIVCEFVDRNENLAIQMARRVLAPAIKDILDDVDCIE